ncbi:hypothetical protein RFI_35006, partial [Reticulomyxa filosa]
SSARTERLLRWNAYVVVTLRNVVCILVPLVVAVVFYNNCGRQWVNYWSLCTDENAQDIVVEYQWHAYIHEDRINGQISTTTEGLTSFHSSLPLLYWSDICKSGFYQSFQSGECIRELIEKWCNVMILKMLLNALMPWVHVWFVNHVWFKFKLLCLLGIQKIYCLRWIITDNSDNLDNTNNTNPLSSPLSSSSPPPSSPPPRPKVLNVEYCSLVSNLELTLLIGLFCPLIIPLCILALLSNHKKCTYVQRHGWVLSVNSPPFPFLFLGLAFISQQIIWILLLIGNDSMFASAKACSYLLCGGFLFIDLAFVCMYISHMPQFAHKFITSRRTRSFSQPLLADSEHITPL